MTFEYLGRSAGNTVAGPLSTTRIRWLTSPFNDGAIVQGDACTWAESEFVVFVEPPIAIIVAQSKDTAAKGFSTNVAVRSHGEESELIAVVLDRPSVYKFISDDQCAEAGG